MQNPYRCDCIAGSDALRLSGAAFVEEIPNVEEMA